MDNLVRLCTMHSSYLLISTGLPLMLALLRALKVKSDYITTTDDVITCTTGKIAHATVGRIALVMALGAASGGLTSTIVSGLVQVSSDTK